MSRFQKLERPGAISREAIAPPTPESAPPTAADYPEAVALADEHYFQGEYKDALRHYSRAIQGDSTHVYPWIGQVSALIGMRQFNEAKVWSDRALDHFPEDPALLAQRARVLAHTGDTKRAIGVSDYAMSKGANAWAWLARAEVLVLARNGNAGFCFQKAVEAAPPDDWRIPYLCGSILRVNSKDSSAIEYFAQALQRNPRHAQGWYEYGASLHRLGFTDRAMDAIKRALELNPRHVAAKKLHDELEKPSVLNKLLGYLRR